MADIVRSGAPEPLASPAAPPLTRPARLVVVTTGPDERGGAGVVRLLTARYWHPREARWIELPVESAEHAIRLLEDANGWVLRQAQVLESPEHHELIFEVRIEQLARPSAADVLENEVGLAPKDVEELLQRVDEQVDIDRGPS